MGLYLQLYMEYPYSYMEYIWDYMAQRLQTTDPKWDASLSLLTGVNHPVAPTDDMYQAS